MGPAGTGGLSDPNVVHIDQFSDTDDVTRIEKAIAALPTGGQRRGGTIIVPNRPVMIGRTVNLPVWPDKVVRFLGFGPGTEGEDPISGMGSRFVAATSNLVMFRQSPGSSATGARISQVGVEFDHCAFSGQGGLSNVRALEVINTNRLKLRDVAFKYMRSGIYLDSTEETGGDGDSAWHSFIGVNWRNVDFGLETRHVYGFELSHFNFVHYRGGETGKVTAIAILNPPTSGVASQSVHISHGKIDCLQTSFPGVGVGIDMAGNLCKVSMVAFERCHRGFWVRKVGTGGHSGRDNTFRDLSFGSCSEMFRVEAGAQFNLVDGIREIGSPNAWVNDEPTTVITNLRAG